MTTFSTSKIRELLGDVESGPDQDVLSTHSCEKGPGYFDIYRQMRGEKAPWQQSESSRVQRRKKKIIFADSVSWTTLSEPKLAFISGLHNSGYEIYPWPGAGKRFSEVSPFASSTEFWKQRGKIKGALKEHLLAELAEQGKSADDYIVLDWQNCSELLSKISAEAGVPAIETGYVKAKRTLSEEEKQRVKDSHIKKIIIQAENTDDIDTILSLYPHVETILIKNVDRLWVEKNFIKLKDKKIIIDPYRDSVFFYLPQYELASLHIQFESSDKLSYFRMIELNNNSLKHFRANLTNESALTLTECKGLETLDLSYDDSPGAEFSAFELPKDSSLRQIRISNFKNRGEELDLREFKKLESVSLPNCDFKSVKTTDPKIITPSRDTSKSKSLNEVKKPKDVHSLELNSVMAEDNDKFNIFTELESLVISSMWSPPEFPTLSITNSKLSEFCLYRDYDHNTVNISSLSLKTVNVTSCQKLIEFRNDVPKSSISNLSFHVCPNLISSSSSLILTELIEFTIEDCPKFTDFTSLNPNLKRLTVLNNANCPDLKKLNQLDYLKLSTVPLAKINAPNLVIKHLILDNMPIDGRHFLDIKEVEELEILNCSLSTLTLPNNLKLKRLTIMNCNQLRNLDLSQFPELESITIHNCAKLDSFTVGPNPALKYLNISHIKQSIFDLTAASEIENVSIQTNVTQINAKNLTNLREITVTSIDPTLDLSLDVSNCKKLSLLTANTNSTCYINTYECVALEELAVAAPNVQVRNLETCGQISTANIKCNNTEEITTQLIRETPYLQPQITRKNQEIKAESKAGSPLFTQEQIQLNRNNKKRKRSRFSPTVELQIDGNTGIVTTPRKAVGDFEIELFSQNNNSTISDYRIHVYDTIVQDAKNNISFPKQTYHPTASTEQKIEYVEITPQITSTMQENVVQNDLYEMGKLTGLIMPGTYLPLPSSTPFKNKESLKQFIQAPPPSSLQLHWDETKKQYYMYLPSESPHPQKLNVLFRMEKQKNYSPKNLPLQNAVFTDRPLLSAELNVAIRNRVISTKNTELKFLIDEKLTPMEKLNQLKRYYEGKFELKALGSSDASFNTLWDIIEKRVGVCRHRSRSFLLLAKFIGLDARLVENEDHSYVEIPYPTRESNGSTSLEWAKYDLGGGDYIDLTDDLPNQFSSAPRPITSAALPKHAIPFITPPIRPVQAQDQIELKELEDRFERIKAKQKINSLLDLLTLQNPLIELGPSQTPLDINRFLFHKTLEDKKSVNEYLYIHKPSDLALYMNPLRFSDDGRVESASDGPLNRIITNGGIVVINWDNFSIQEKVIYKSMLDKDAPAIDGKPINKKCKIIGLTTNPQKDISFISRCNRCSLSSLEISETSTLTVEHKEPAPTPLNLYSLLSWRSYLFGNVTYDEKKGAEIKMGALIHSMDPGTGPGKVLVLQNPPDDPDFYALIKQVRDEKRVFHQGKWVQAKPGFEIRVENVPRLDYIAQFNKWITVNAGETKDEKDAKSEEKPRENKIYLGLHNYYDLFSQLVINEEGRLVTQPGLLDQFNPDKDTFYLIDTLPQNYLEKIIAEIEKRFPESSHPTWKCHITLSPGVKIDGIAKATSVVSPIPWTTDELKPTTPRTIASNDPDYCCQELTKGQTRPLIIDLTAQSSYSDLIADYRVSPEAKSAVIIKGLLQALMEGRRVILNGEPKPFLRRLLMPLLENPPSIVVNGKLFTPTGELFLVEKTPPPNIAQVSRKYDASSYLAAFPDDKAHVKNLLEFFSYAMKLPHNDKVSPGLPELSYHRLKSMLAALKTPGALHKNNPIKGLFLYHYPRYSESYAYLNVIGKNLFSASLPDEKPRRDKKLKQLTLRYMLDTPEKCKEYEWALLNCFNGNEIKKILGDKLDQSIDTSLGRPRLSTDAFQRLLTAMQAPVLRAGAQSIKAPTRLKKLSEFKAILAEADKPIVFLKGPAAAGKTYIVDHLNPTQYVLFYDQSRIQEWLESKPGERKSILVLDEGNMLLPRTLDFLKGLVHGQKSIFYDGKEYPIDENFKVVITGNPEDYPRRYHHQIIQDMAEIVFVSKPSRDVLAEQITPLLIQQNLQKYLDKLISASELIEKYIPYFDTGRREIKNLAYRFVILAKESKNERDTESALLSACISEFSVGIKDNSKRELFEDELCMQLGIDKTPVRRTSALHKISDEYYLPHEKKYLLDAINQNLAMRDHSYLSSKEIEDDKKAKIDLPYKYIVLIQGDPGVGKTALLLNLMQQRAAKNPESPAAKYYHVTAGAKGSFETIKHALCTEGAIVIVDEQNIDENLEAYLISLEGQIRPGGMILASQNSSDSDARNEMSEAMRSRAHYMDFGSFSDRALRDLAAQKSIRPELVVQAYQKSKLSMRAFHAVVDDELNQTISKLILEYYKESIELKDMEQKLTTHFKSTLIEMANHPVAIPADGSKSVLQLLHSPIESKRPILMKIAMTEIDFNNPLSMKEFRRRLEVNLQIMRPTIEDGICDDIREYLALPQISSILNKSSKFSLFTPKEAFINDQINIIMKEEKETNLSRINKLYTLLIKEESSQPGAKIIFDTLIKAISTLPFTRQNIRKQLELSEPKLSMTAKAITSIRGST